MKSFMFVLALAISLVIPGLAAAQNIAVQSRITERVDDTVLTVLRGNTHPLARPQNDQGAVADSQPLQRVLLLLQRSPDQEAALKQLMNNQQSSASQNYHKWLTPQQFGQQFGPADADIQTVTDWLTSHGFQVARISNGRTLIEFSGTAGQVRNAFHTEIHRYLVNGEQHFANSSDPQIPTALTPVVAGPVSLHNFPKHALSKKLGVFRKTTTTGKVAPLYTFSNDICGNNPCNALGPGDFATIYNVLNLWNPGINGTKIDGTEQTIAIVGDSEICTQNSPDWNANYIGGNGTTLTCNSDDVAAFRTLFGLPANPPNVILDGPDPSFNGDETEGDLDVEWSGAVAKNATIDFVIAQGTDVTLGVDLAALYVVDNNLAPVLSESFGACELYLGSFGNSFEASLWEQAAAQGMTVIVAAGDSGSATCDDPYQIAAYQFGPAVNGIASTPFDVAAGGTDFDVTLPTPGSYQNQYWASPNNNMTVNGITDVSALSYIPETTWNDSCAQNFTGSIAACTPTLEEIFAGGGGESNCAYYNEYYASTCLSYAKPPWQTVASGSGLTSANDLTRDLPDIALFAADGYISNSFYIICEADLDPNGAACDLATPYFDFVGVGGTSAAAPTFAGMMALVNQNMAVNHPNLSDPILGARQGNANYVLYNLAATQDENGLNCNSSSTSLSSSCTFNDITKGNNSVPCVFGYEDYGCSNTSSSEYNVEEAINLGNDVPTGFLAWDTAPGLDLATGLGSVNAYNLVSNWPTAVGLFTPTTTTLCLSTTNTNKASCSGPIGPIVHGKTVFVNTTVNANGSPIPVSTTYGRIGVDSDPFAPQVAEDVSLVGAFSGGNTGPADQFTSNYYELSNADIFPLTNGTTVGQNYGTNYLVGGTYSVVAHYAGDGTYGGSDSPPISVTVTPEASTALIATEEGCCGSYGQFGLLRVDVVGASSGQENATGTLTLTDNGVPISNSTGGSAINFLLNEGYLEYQTLYLAAGSHNIVAKYNGDASYTASSTSATLKFRQAVTTTTLTPSTTSIVPNQSITLTAFVDTDSYGNFPTGSVTFFNGATQIGIVPNNQLVAMSDPLVGSDAVQATLTTTLSATADITATYSGDTNYATSTSTEVFVTLGSVSSPQPGCSSALITIGNPGQSGNCVITMTGADGFGGTITLSAVVATEPAHAFVLPTCSFGAPGSNFTAPNTITLSAASETGSATLTCATTAASRTLFRPSNRPSGRTWPLAAAGLLLICFFFLLGVPKQRRWTFAPLAVLLIVLVVAGVGCDGSSSGGGSGSSGGGGTTGPGTTPGIYTVNVYATSPGYTIQAATVGINVME